MSTGDASLEEPKNFTYGTHDGWRMKRDERRAKGTLKFAKELGGAVAVKFRHWFPAREILVTMDIYDRRRLALVKDGAVEYSTYGK